MPRRVPDLAKIRERLGWQPTRDLEQILTDVIEHQRETGAS